MDRIIKPWFFTASLFYGVAVSSVSAATPTQTSLGTPAPTFETKTLSGKTFSLKNTLGRKPVYLKFWATWCSYCKAEMPHLQQLENTYGEDITIVSINVGLNDSIANIEQLYRANGYQLETIFDHNGDITSAYEVVGTPHHVLINRKGEIVYRSFLMTDELDDLITNLAKGE